MAPKLGTRGRGGSRGDSDSDGQRSNGDVPGEGVIADAVNNAGGFPKRYKGLNWSKDEDPWPNMVRGKIGEDLAAESARLRGERVIASQVKVHRADATSIEGSSNIDHVVKTADGKYVGVEVKTGNADLTDGQKEHYPNVPEGGLKVMTDKLEPMNIESGDILRRGQISSVRLERWDIDSMPAECKSKLDEHTVADILDGKAGPERAAELRDWIQSDDAYKVDQTWEPKKKK